jgi:hypothetical protein
MKYKSKFTQEELIQAKTDDKKMMEILDKCNNYIYNIAYKVYNSFYIYNNSVDIEDLVSDIKMNIISAIKNHFKIPVYDANRDIHGYYSNCFGFITKVCKNYIGNQKKIFESIKTHKGSFDILNSTNDDSDDNTNEYNEARASVFNIQDKNKENILKKELTHTIKMKFEGIDEKILLNIINDKYKSFNQILRKEKINKKKFYELIGRLKCKTNL